MSHAYAPCDDCGKPTRVPEDHPVDYAYCGCDDPALAARQDHGTPSTRSGSRRRIVVMRSTGTTLVCTAGHETDVLPWGTPPLACPHCSHGVPCKMPLTVKRGARKAVSA